MASLDMRRIALGFVLAALPTAGAYAQSPTASSIAASSDQARLAVAKDIVAIAFPQNTRLGMFDDVMRTLMGQMRTAQLGNSDFANEPEVKLILDRYFNRMIAEIKMDLRTNMSGLFDAISGAYAREFSLDELKEIHTFVATPAGAKYIQRSPKLMADSEVAAWNTAFMGRVKATTEARVEDLKQQLLKYAEKKSSTE